MNKQEQLFHLTCAYLAAGESHLGVAVDRTEGALYYFNSKLKTTNKNESESKPVTKNQNAVHQKVLTCKKYLSILPEPYLTMALEQLNIERIKECDEAESLTDALYVFSDWSKTKEGSMFWVNVHDACGLGNFSKLPLISSSIPKNEDSNPKAPVEIGWLRAELKALANGEKLHCNSTPDGLAIEAKLAAANAKIKELETQNKDLLARSTEIATDINMLETQLHNALEEIAAQKIKRSSLQKDYDSASKTLKALETKIEDRDAEIKQLKDAASNFETETTKKWLTISHLEQELALERARPTAWPEELNDELVGKTYRILARVTHGEIVSVYKTLVKIMGGVPRQRTYSEAYNAMDSHYGNHDGVESLEHAARILDADDNKAYKNASSKKDN